jgi:hypothetical protein
MDCQWKLETANGVSITRRETRSAGKSPRLFLAFSAKMQAVALGCM